MRLNTLCGSVALALVGCGAGGSDSGSGVPPPGQSNNLPISTAADILREIGILDSGADIVDREAYASPAASHARIQRSAVHRLDTTTMPCGSNNSGTSTQNTGTENYAFSYFTDSPQSLTFNQTTYSGCSGSSTDSSGVTVSEKTQGYYEFDSSADENANPDYQVFQYGINGGTYESAQSQSQNGVVTSAQDYVASGKTEVKSDADFNSEERSILSFENTQTDNGASHSLTFSLGTSSTYFDRQANDASDPVIVGLSGEYRYTSSLCGGSGGAAATTPTPLTSTDESGFFMVTGGTLQLVTDSVSVSIRFNSDGSATYQFAGGASGTLSAADLEEQFNHHPCS